MSCSPTALHVIADAAAFGAAITVSADSEFVQIHVHDAGTTRTFARPMRRRDDAIAQIRLHVCEVAAMVSTPSLVNWLADVGFDAVN